MKKINLKEIEVIEYHYLKKYFHFLKFAEDELLLGFKTKEKIKDDWIGLYKSGISDFAVGAERIVYSLLNGKGIGLPNSAPVGADLFFEVENAFIHLDLKTVGATLHPRYHNHPDGTWSNNIGDYTNNIFVGTNQNSYKSEIKKSDGSSFNPPRYYEPSLPAFYNKNKANQKICISYFITILYDKDTLDILVLSILCMPNGELERHYKSRVLQAGKNIDKTRFRFTEVPTFELLNDTPNRIMVVYFDKSMDESYRSKLEFFEKLYDNQ
ncbi:MAG: hypothetical protein BGO30_10650 [Bacteroidetes bacterium 41-46]|nr:MAG: hypothetical protein BGO30_10650 [Bacteroidetes bacterium 41-46]